MCARDFCEALWIELGIVGFFLLFGIWRWKWPDWPRLWSYGRLMALILSSAGIMILCSARPIDLMQTPQVSPAKDHELVTIELGKANAEIQYRIQQEDTWFHYKFLFVGALFAGFFTKFRLGHNSRRTLLVIVSSTTTCLVLALACIVAVAIDIHLRNNIIVIQQLALWIRYYAEPSLASTVHTGFQAWEEFLRAPGGMHRDEMYGFLFYPHLHFLTWILYVLYLGSFHWLSINPKSRRTDPENVLMASGFLGVHAALGAFAFVGHFVPRALKTKAMPFIGNCWQTGASAAWGYLLLVLMLIAVNSPYLVRFLRLKRVQTSA
jgi:hypothetical protein